jgi:hypothetical protein
VQRDIINRDAAIPDLRPDRTWCGHADENDPTPTALVQSTSGGFPQTNVSLHLNERTSKNRERNERGAILDGRFRKYAEHGKRSLPTCGQA